MPDPLANANWTLVPSHLRAAFRAYVEHGDMDGQFVQAVIRNDLRSAIRVASFEELRWLYDIVTFCERNFPPLAWGNDDRVANWIDVGGAAGRASIIADYDRAVSRPPQPYKR